AGVSTSCAPPSSLLPVPLSLQYGSSVWEAAIPLFSRPLHPKVLLWVLAPLSPPQSMSGTELAALSLLQIAAILFLLVLHSSQTVEPSLE
ncbi:hypothetical protein KUCAC02_003454, partial [Chaenocephalus aceratus]